MVGWKALSLHFSLEPVGSEFDPVLLHAFLRPQTMCELALLYTTKGHLFCAGLKPLLREVWGCDELIPGVMFEIVCDTREEFKHTSN